MLEATLKGLLQEPQGPSAGELRSAALQAARGCGSRVPRLQAPALKTDVLSVDHPSSLMGSVWC